MLEPETNYQLFNMIISSGYKDASARLAACTYLNLNMLWSNPRNKNVEK